MSPAPALPTTIDTYIAGFPEDVQAILQKIRATVQKAAAFLPPADVAAHVDDRTRLVFGETVGNPRLNVLDIPAWADAAHAHGLKLKLRILRRVSWIAIALVYRAGTATGVDPFALKLDAVVSD